MAVLTCGAVAGSCVSRPELLSVDALAEAYVRLTLQFAQHRPALVDSWRGPAEWNPGPRVPVAALRSRVDDLLAHVERGRLSGLDATDAPRVAYLGGQLRALSHVASRLLGEATPFAEEIRLAFGVEPPAVDRRQATRAHQALAAELAGEGRLRERYLDFVRRFEVPAPRFDAALAAALAVCRTHAAPLELPRTERVEFVVDPAAEWPAFARYTGNQTTVVTWRTRAGHSLATLLHTVCHETVPGHHAQHVLIDDALVRGRRWVEFQLAPAFGPHLLIAEGGAEAATLLALPGDRYAAILAGFMRATGFDPSDAPRLGRVARLAASLEPLVPSIVGRYLDNQATREATIAALADAALLADPDGFLSFAERHRSTAVIYPLGHAVVSGHLAQRRAEDRWRTVRDLFTVKPFLLE